MSPEQLAFFFFFGMDLHKVHSVSILVAFLEHFCHQLKTFCWLKILRFSQTL